MTRDVAKCCVIPCFPSISQQLTDWCERVHGVATDHNYPCIIAFHKDNSNVGVCQVPLVKGLVPRQRQSLIIMSVHTVLTVKVPAATI